MEGNAFVSRVMEGAKIWLIGGMMPLDNLGNRVRIGKMKREAPDGREFLGLLHSGRVRLADARLSGLSAESRFDLAYNAAHALALAALRWHGYRSDNRYLVFQVLEFTMGFPSFVWRVLALCHERWSLAAYEGHLEVDERLLQDLLSAAGELLTRLEAMAPP
jgi:hypothetical protein